MRYSIKDYSKSAAVKGWGQGWPACTAKTQTAVITAPISGVKVVVHKRIARLAYLLIAETERRGYLLVAGQTWGGNCRAIAGTNVSSNHAWWLAIDIRSLTNPYIKKGLRVTDVPDWMVLLWNSFGWAWGGAYGDSMHWEFMGSPEDADEMTALAEVRLQEAQQRDGVWVITDMEDDLDAHQARQLTEVLGRLQGITGLNADGSFNSDPIADEVWRKPQATAGYGGAVPPIIFAEHTRDIVGALADRDDVHALAAALAPLLPGSAPAVLARLSDEDVKRVAKAAADEDDARERARLGA